MTTAQTADAETAEGVAAELRAAELRATEIRRALPQWVADAAGFKAAPARNPSLPTLVGLLILILCFFVVLTSISLRDQKREHSVMSSLEHTFAGQGAARNAPGADQDTHRILGNLRASITAQVPLVTGTAATSADDLMLALPRNLVFAADGDTLAEDFPRILQQTKAALAASPSGFAYEVEIAIASPKRDKAAIALAALVDRAVRAAGFAPGSAVVSLTEGKPDSVALIVRLRPNARLDNPGAEP
jgi:hypothetical protein